MAEAECAMEIESHRFPAAGRGTAPKSGLPQVRLRNYRWFLSRIREFSADIPWRLESMLRTFSPTSKSYCNIPRPAA